MSAPTTRSKSDIRTRKRHSEAFLRHFDSYLVGSIVQITLTDFVTYDHVQFSPGCNLNMVIGPNGTGKSTIVCAIALGLGGKPDILGRAKEVREFVKKNKERAIIEIELKTEDGTVIIERSFKATSNTSTWKVDGHPTSEKDIRELIQSLNIQVDNLCQFLPQDRVADFAKMEPHQLLVATERAAGSENLLFTHEKLISQGKELKGLEIAFETQAESLASLEKKQALQEELVEKLKEREKHLKEAKILNMAIPWAEYDALQKELQAVNAEKTAVEQELLGREERLKPVTELTKALRTAAHKAKLVVRSAGDTLNRDGLTKVTAAQEAISQNEETERAHGAEVKRAKKSLDEWKVKLDVAHVNSEKAEREVNRLKAELDANGMLDGNGRQGNPENSPEIKQIHQRIEEVMAEAECIRAEANSVVDQKQPLFEEFAICEQQRSRLREELKHSASVANQKLKVLKTYNGVAHQAVEFLRSNHGIQFEKEVFEPICLGISATDPDLAKALESFIGYTRLVSFVTQTPNDYTRLRDVLYDTMHLRVNIVCVENVRTSFRSSIPQEEVERLGFDGVLIDYVKGHPVLLSALMQYTPLADTPINLAGDRNFNFGLVDNHSNIRSYVHGDYSFSVRGAYGSKSTRSEQMRNAQILKLSVDTERQAQLENRMKATEARLTELKGLTGALDAKDKVLRDRYDDLKKQRSDLVTKKREILNRRAVYDRKLVEAESAKDRVHQVTNNMEKAQQRLKDLDAQKQRYSIERAKLAMSFIKRTLETCSLFDKVIQANVDRVQLEAESGDAATVENNANQQNVEIKNLFEQISKKFDDIRRSTKQALNTAKSSVPEGITDSEKEEVVKIKEGKTADELRDQLTRVQARADMLGNTDPRAIEQFEKRKLDIEGAKARQEQSEKEINALKLSMERARNQWEKELESLVKKINDQFSECFNKIGCAGEVKLGKDDDFEKWRIDILVKFRDNEKLQILNKFRQSGGERAVTTISYLMALQRLSKAPFRVVDEINQGMDPRNERAVHSQMVEIACAPKSSQYFLITPKLLPHLEYHRKMKILTIYNGDHQPEKFDVEGFLRQKKRVKV